MDYSPWGHKESDMTEQHIQTENGHPNTAKGVRGR